MLSAKVAKLEGSPLAKGHLREYTEINPAADSNVPASNSRTLSRELTPLRPAVLNSVSNSGKRAVDRKASTGTENEAPSSYRKITDKLFVAAPSSVCRTMASLPSLRNEQRQDAGSHNKGLPSSMSSNGAYPSPTRRHELLMRRQSRMRLTGEAGSPVKSSPSLTAAVERQFGMSTNGSPVRKKSWRDGIVISSSPAQSKGSRADSEGVEVHDFAPGALNESSQGMVDSFLQSRRRRMKGSTTSGETSSPAMFL